MAESAERVYHVELRQFPHNMCRFNVSAQELRAAVLEPWLRDRWVEFGERKWTPHQATLTVLEGPRIPVGQLTMGRGWRTAQRKGREVTEELLAALTQELEAAAAGRAAARQEAAARLEAAGSGAPREVPAGGSPGTGDGPLPLATGAGAVERATLDRRAEDLAADSLGLELLARIGVDRAPLSQAWELAAERHPGSPPSATLALAERAVESLLRARLIVLLAAEDQAGDARPEGEAEAEGTLGLIASWAGAGAAGGVWIRRA